MGGCRHLDGHLAHHLEAQLQGDTAAGDVRPVVMDLDVGHSAQPETDRGEGSRRTGRETATYEGRVHPVADLEAVGRDPSHEARPAHDTSAPEHPIVVLAPLGPSPVPAFDQRLALVQAQRLARDPGHVWAQVLQALGYRHRQSGRVAAVVSPQREVFENDLLGRSSGRALHALILA